MISDLSIHQEEIVKPRKAKKTETDTMINIVMSGM